MATTPKLGLTLLDVGQKQKEATINDAFNKIDAGTLVITTYLESTTQYDTAIISPALATGYTANYAGIRARTRPVGTAGRELKVRARQTGGGAVGGEIIQANINADGSDATTQDGWLTIRNHPSGSAAASSIQFSNLGQVSIASGGGQNLNLTAAGAINLSFGASSPLQIQANAGTAGQVLSSNGASARPTWLSIPVYLGDAASDPATSFPFGSTYFNTATSKLKVLRASGWSNAA